MRSFFPFTFAQPHSSASNHVTVQKSHGIECRVALDFIRYGNCWEDADVLCEALLPADQKRVLSIASAGDNVFALLAEGAEVVAADLNAVQLACLDLRTGERRWKRGRYGHGQVILVEC